MKCECFNKVHQEQIASKLQEITPKLKITDGEFLQTALQFADNGVILRSFTEFEYTAAMIKKDGNLGREQKKKISMFHTFCPFCGVKQEEEEQEETTGEEAAGS